MLLDDREGIRRRASQDWIGAAPLIARKQIDRLNMGVELLTEIGSIECRSWRRSELPQKWCAESRTGGGGRIPFRASIAFIRAASAV